LGSTRAASTAGTNLAGGRVDSGVIPTTLFRSVSARSSPGVKIQWRMGWGGTSRCWVMWRVISYIPGMPISWVISRNTRRLFRFIMLLLNWNRPWSTLMYPLPWFISIEEMIKLVLWKKQRRYWSFILKICMLD
jgi:hypothetical protein